MRIAVSITQTIRLDIPEGITIEEVRQEALGQITDDYSDPEEGPGPACDIVYDIVTRAIKVGEATSTVVEVRIAEEEVK